MAKKCIPKNVVDVLHSNRLRSRLRQGKNQDQMFLQIPAIQVCLILHAGRQA